MRALRFGASIFAQLFIGIAVMSALATKAVHIQVMSRTASALFQYSQPPNAVSGQARTYCGVASFAFCHPIKCVRNDATSVLSPTEGVVAYCGASAARELGLAASLREVPSMALGSNELTLLDLTRAFASVRAGRKLEPWGIAAFGPDGGSIRSLGAPAVKGHSLQQSDHYDATVTRSCGARHRPGRSKGSW